MLYNMLFADVRNNKACLILCAYIILSNRKIYKTNWIKYNRYS